MNHDDLVALFRRVVEASEALAAEQAGTLAAPLRALAGLRDESEGAQMVAMLRAGLPT